MKCAFLILALLTAACGKGGSQGVPANTLVPVPKTSAGQSIAITLIASRNPGNDSPASVVASQAGRVTLPQPSDLKVLANASDFYHATLTVGTVTCDYVHNSGDGAFSAGAGCSTANGYVDVTQSTVISLDITNTVSQGTQIQLSLILSN